MEFTGYRLGLAWVFMFIHSVRSQWAQIGPPDRDINGFYALAESRTTAESPSFDSTWYPPTAPLAPVITFAPASASEDVSETGWEVDPYNPYPEAASMQNFARLRTGSQGQFLPPNGFQVGSQGSRFNPQMVPRPSEPARSKDAYNSAAGSINDQVGFVPQLDELAGDSGTERSVFNSRSASGNQQSEVWASPEKSQLRMPPRNPTRPGDLPPRAFEFSPSQTPMIYQSQPPPQYAMSNMFNPVPSGNWDRSPERRDRNPGFQPLPFDRQQMSPDQNPPFRSGQLGPREPPVLQPQAFVSQMERPPIQEPDGQLPPWLRGERPDAFQNAALRQENIDGIRRERPLQPPASVRVQEPRQSLAAMNPGQQQQLYRPPAFEMEQRRPLQNRPAPSISQKHPMGNFGGSQFEQERNQPPSQDFPPQFQQFQRPREPTHPFNGQQPITRDTNRDADFNHRFALSDKAIPPTFQKQRPQQPLSFEPGYGPVANLRKSLYETSAELGSSRGNSTDTNTDSVLAATTSAPAAAAVLPEPGYGPPIPMKRSST